MAATLHVEVAIAWPEKQLLIEVAMPEGSTVLDAINATSIGEQFPDVSLDEMPVGVWGQLVERNRQLRDGDRVEIYRELKLDPRDARRQLAESGRTMRE